MPIQLADPGAETVALLDDLRRIVQVLRESSRAAEQRLGVSGAQLFVLRALANEPAQALNDLARRTRTHQSTVSVVVKRLVENGLVRRSTAAADGRRVELSLTARGRALLDKSPLAAQERLIEAVEALKPLERKHLASGLRRLVHAMNLEAHAPDMFFEERSTSESKGKRRVAT